MNYHEYLSMQLTDPEFRRIYEEEAEKKELWRQLVEARQATGLTQEQVAERMGVSPAQVVRIEQGGYDAYTLRTLRRYVEALGDEFSLQITLSKGRPNRIVQYTESPALEELEVAEGPWSSLGQLAKAAMKLRKQRTLKFPSYRRHEKTASHEPDETSILHADNI